jgi:hypothetical protein
MTGGDGPIWPLSARDLVAVQQRLGPAKPDTTAGLGGVSRLPPTPAADAFELGANPADHLQAILGVMAHHGQPAV